MRHEYTWVTPDGITIFAQYWEPETESKGVVNFIHGLGEHSGRYGDLAGEITEQGYVFFTCDLRGSGKSGGKRGHTPSYEFLLNDIEHLLQEARVRYPCKAQFLYGHSLGGNLTLNYVLRRRPDLKGVIVTSPWLKLTLDPPIFKIALGEIIDLFWPSFSQHNGISARALSHDLQVVEEYQRDPFVHNKISVRLFFEAFRAGHWALDHHQEFSLPLLLMHGTEDGITSPQSSEDFAEGISQCTLRLWPGQFHELHHEFIKEEFYKFIVSWLDSHRHL
ncbi:MAG: lysophospholipase [Peptococcaceae bacterium]